MLGCGIAIIKSVDRIPPTILDLMLLGSVILELFSCQLAMTIVRYQVILMVLKPALKPLREA